MDRRIPDYAVLGPTPAGLELRLHEGDDRSATLPIEGARDGHEDPIKGDERYVDDRKGDELGQDVGAEPTGVRPLHRDDTEVRTESFGELSAAHVESIDT